MRNLKSYEIRQMWLDFWSSKGHQVFPSASLVPVNDPTLLWINAGVAPLKKFFDGREVPTNRRITNAQKAIRTNDIENVGRTARHHTFFEMLGNFSVGDYFRKEALTWAFEILTSEKWFGFDLNKLYFTVYTGDEESINIWKSLGVDESHIIPLKDNFWEIGEGPCGPDSEIFYDRGEKYDPQNLGIKMLKEDIENDRYIEIWNIVFSQYNSKPGTPREEYEELPSKNIDTGMGLERMACVMQEVETNYETDLFMPYIKKVEEITGVKYEGQMAFKVIADHVRSVTFAVSDGAMLSNEGRGYVLRRILRRAVRYGKQLGMKEPFLYKLVEEVCNYMSNFYPYLLETKDMVSKVVKLEEEKFLQTLENGEKKLHDYLVKQNNDVVDAKFAFQLYDTFGFPIELTVEAASEVGKSVDLEGFKLELQKQKELARSSRNDEQSMNTQNEDMLNFKEDSNFVGYDNLECDAVINGIFSEGSLSSKASGKVVLAFDQTVFYATSGGQIGDSGYVLINGEKYNVLDSFKLPNTQHAVIVETNQEVSLGDTVKLVVDQEKRQASAANHSGTHLLNEALRQVLGTHVVQQGSSVSPDGLRFDFNNFYLPTNEELLKVEALVNQEINKQSVVDIQELPLEEAKKLGVQAVFGEKYGDVVRVVTIGFSKELCGGTHVANTSDIAKFAILGCESKGSGIFRIEAVTGSNLENIINNLVKPVINEINDIKEKIANLLVAAKSEDIELEVAKVEEKALTASYKAILDKKEELVLYREALKELDKQYNKLKREKATVAVDDFLKDVNEVNGVKVLITKTNNLETDVLKDLSDRLGDKLGDCVVFIANVLENKVVFVCKNKTKVLAAGNLVKLAASITLGGGGGRPDFAQAGGKDVTKVDEALEAISKAINEAL